ncbi:hypothetical protein B0T24DRAFT_712405, partial [Lasiosphaeria ovina]
WREECQPLVVFPFFFFGPVAIPQPTNRHSQRNRHSRNSQRSLPSRKRQSEQQRQQRRQILNAEGNVKGGSLYTGAPRSPQIGWLTGGIASCTAARTAAPNPHQRYLGNARAGARYQSSLLAGPPRAEQQRASRRSVYAPPSSPRLSNSHCSTSCSHFLWRFSRWFITLIVEASVAVGRLTAYLLLRRCRPMPSK